MRADKAPRSPRAGEIRECFGCHAKVVVRDDLSCPACKRDMASMRDDGMRRLVVHDRQELPPVCARCGAESDRYDLVSASRSRGEGVSWIGKLGLLVISPILALLVPRKRETSVEVAVPQCSGCASQGKLQPDHVNFETGSMTLLVHRRLRAAARSKR